MAIWKINHFANAATITTAFLAWEDMLEVEAPTYKLFRVWPSVNTLKVETAVADETVFSGAIGNGTVGWVDGTATTGLNISAALALVITNYTVLQVEDEIVVVKSVDRAANTIEVFKRGAGETTGLLHADGVTAEVLGFNMPRGVKDIESNYKEQVIDWNSVGKYTIPALTFTKEALTEARGFYGKQGKEDYVSSQILEKDKDLIRTMNKLMLKGTREMGADETEPGMTRGLLEEATLKGNVSTTFGAIATVKKISDACTASRNKNGKANFILCSPASYDDIQALADVETDLPRPLERLGLELGSKVKAIHTKVGRLVPIMDTDMDDDKMVIGNNADFSIHPFEGFTLPGGDWTVAQASSRNDQEFTYDSICQFVSYFKNSNKNLTIITGVTH